MGQPRFENAAKDMITSIQLCILNRHWIPAVILIYCFIDTMAWLGRAEDQSDRNRKDFFIWTDKYLLPNSNISCSAADLYGARCGVVHSYTSESTSSRGTTAKEIFYEYYVGKQSEQSKVFHKDMGGKSVIVLNIHDLYMSLIRALAMFSKDLAANPKLADMVYKRADKFFGIKFSVLTK